MTEEYEVSFASAEDAEEILEIYKPYIENTAITFEYATPSAEEFKNRIINIKKRYPYIIANYKNKIVGYAYASSFKDRAAYDWAVEMSIYVHTDYRGKGIGKLLYSHIEKLLADRGFLNLYACIAYPETEDEYLTKDSVKFHEKLGYSLIGEFHKCGYKFNRWYNMVWMEKFIGEHKENQEAVQF